MRGRLGVAGVLAVALLLVVALFGLNTVLRAGKDARRVETGARNTPPVAGVEFVGSSDALDERVFEGTDVGGLSGLTYDPRTDLYYSLVDRGGEDARYYTLRASTDVADLGGPDILGVTQLRDPEGLQLTSGEFDGEGIAVSRAGDLFVASEVGPSIRRISPDGRTLEELPVPRKFRVEPEGGGRPNGTFESLALSPDGHSLFTANQAPLAPDGVDDEGRGRVRLLRYENGETADYRPSGEFFYTAEPNRGGVADIAAVSETELLVLEHGQKIFRVSLAGADDVSEEESLKEPGLEPLKKELFVNLANCPTSRVAGSPPDNYEGLTLGPSLANGDRVLLIQSDDGFSTAQITRLVALDVRLHHTPSEAEARACS